MEQFNILILDDQPTWRKLVQVYCENIFKSWKLESESSIANVTFSYTLASTPQEAIHLLENHRFNLMFVDKDLGLSAAGENQNGIDFISKFKVVQPLCMFVMLTADNSYDEIARAFKAGVSDYLIKGDDQSYANYRSIIIRRCVEKYFESLEVSKQIHKNGSRLYSTFICESPAMQRLDNKLKAIAESSRPVVFLGETGLGKGAVARRVSELSRIHFNQNSRDLVQVNFAALDSSLAEARLFGTEPGAFTGASSKTTPGLFDLAKDGDLFLDEIGDASLDLQLKLLKVVEEREFYRVGGKSPIKTNARLIFATNKNLQELILKKQFREDFYMRISTFEETIPTLEERKQDLPKIVESLLAQILKEYPKKRIKYSDFPQDLKSHLNNPKIQGNIRGIENDVVRLVAHLPTDFDGKPDYSEWHKILKQRRHAGIASNVLTVQKIKESKIDLDNGGYTNLKDLMQLLTDKVFEEVKGLSGSAAARKVGVTKPTALSNLKRLEYKSSEDRL